MVQTNFKNFLEYAGDPKRAWHGRATPLFRHLILENYYKRTVKYFCMNPFKLNSKWSKLIFKIFSIMPETSKGRGRATPLFRHLILENYYRRTVKYFCMNPFKLNSKWSKLIFKILSSMPETPKGRGRATPIFCHLISKQI